MDIILMSKSSLLRIWSAYLTCRSQNRGVDVGSETSVDCALVLISLTTPALRFIMESTLNQIMTMAATMTTGFPGVRSSFLLREIQSMRIVKQCQDRSNIPLHYSGNGIPTKSRSRNRSSAQFDNLFCNTCNVLWRCDGKIFL